MDKFTSTLHKLYKIWNILLQLNSEYSIISGVFQKDRGECRKDEC